jgi:hypothetical protein
VTRSNSLSFPPRNFPAGRSGEIERLLKVLMVLKVGPPTRSPASAGNGHRVGFHRVRTWETFASVRTEARPHIHSTRRSA